MLAEDAAQGLVQEVRRGVQRGGGLGLVGQAALELLLGTGTARLLVLREGLGKAGFVHREAALGRHLDGQFDREAEGLVEVEGLAAADDLALDMGGEAVDQLAELADAALQGAGELAFLGLEVLQDAVAMLAELGIDVLVLVDDHPGQAGREGLRHAQLARLTDGPADQPAQDVRLVDIAGTHAVGHQEGHRPQMLGQDAAAALALRLGQARDLANRREQPGEQLGLVAAPLALQNRGDALDAHAGVDIALRQRHKAAVGLLVVLHEDVVPDLHPALVRGIEDRRGLALAGPAEHLRVRTAGAGLARRAPPVVLLRHVVDAVLRDAERAPDPGRLVVARRVRVAGEHGHPQLRRVDPQRAREELVAPDQRILLEVVAQGPVA